MSHARQPIRTRERPYYPMSGGRRRDICSLRALHDCVYIKKNTAKTPQRFIVSLFKVSGQLYLLLTPRTLKLRRRITSSRERSAISTLAGFRTDTSAHARYVDMGGTRAMRDGQQKGSKYTRTKRENARRFSHSVFCFSLQYIHNFKPYCNREIKHYR